MKSASNNYLLEQLTKGKPERELPIIEEYFLTTSRFEYLCWDTVYQGGDWPV